MSGGDTAKAPSFAEKRSATSRSHIVTIHRIVALGGTGVPSAAIRDIRAPLRMPAHSKLPLPCASRDLERPPSDPPMPCIYLPTDASFTYALARVQLKYARGGEIFLPLPLFHFLHGLALVDENRRPELLGGNGLVSTDAVHRLGRKCGVGAA